MNQRAFISSKANLRLYFRLARNHKAPILCYVFLTCDLLVQSNLSLFLFGPVGKTLILGAEVIALSCALISIISHVGSKTARLVFAASLSLALLLLLQLFVFSENFGRPLLLTAIGQFLALLSAPAIFLDRKNLDRVLRYVFRIAVIYAAFYIFLSLLVPIDVSNPLRLNDSIREERLFLAHAYVAYGLFYSLSLLKKGKARYLVSLVVCAAALFLAQSRVVSVIVLVLAGLQTFNVNRRLVGSGVFLITLTGFAVLLFGIIDTSFNPFYYMLSDERTIVRYYSYAAAIDLIRAAPLTGSGLPSSVLDVAYATWADNFANSDLGVVGIWNGFGVLGVAFVCSLSYGACFVLTRRNTNLAEYVHYTYLTIISYSIIAPMLYGPGQIFVSFLLFSLCSTKGQKVGIPGPRLRKAPS